MVRELLKNEKELVNLALVADVRREAPSSVLGVSDELTAFEFDAAVAFAFRESEAKRDYDRMKLLVGEIKIAAVELLTGKNIDRSGSGDLPDGAEEW